MGHQKSLFESVVFNIIKTFSSLAFPVITFGYASRKLGDLGIGQVSFVKSFIAYFAMLAMLGMNYYGTREAAKLRDDRGALSIFTREMLVINGCTTALACTLALLCFLMIPRFRGYGWVFVICALAIPLQGLGMEWLYQALEEYRYIAVRSVAFQIIALISMFLFVKKEGDIAAYAAVSLIASSGSYVLNFVNVRKYVDLSVHRQLEIKRHIKPLLWLFAQVVSVELYTVLDSTMLGFLQGDAAVGRYAAAVKVNRMVNSLIAAVGVVLVPRLSYYIGKGESEKVKELVKKAYNFTFLLSVPAAVGLFILSDEIILWLSGDGFASAGLTMRIMTPIVVLIPFSVATNQQLFVPMKKEKLILISTLAGAATNFTANLILIPRFAENGAAIGTVVAETVVALVCLRNAGKVFDMRQIFRRYYQYWLAAAPIPMIAMVCEYLRVGFLLQITSTMMVSGICYFAILYMQRNPYLLEARDVVRNNAFHI